MKDVSPGFAAATDNDHCAHCGASVRPGSPHVCADGPTAAIERAAGAVDNRDAPSMPDAQEPDPLLGTVLSERYELQARIGRGGMGVVYRARHTLLNRTVAVKVLLKQRTEVDQRRFLQEARLASQVVHPNIVYISDFGLLPDKRPYLVMEFIEGPTLSRVLRRSPNHRIDLLRACKITLQIAQGMQAVHDQGIVHREPDRRVFSSRNGLCGLRTEPLRKCAGGFACSASRPALGWHRVAMWGPLLDLLSGSR